MCEYRATPLCIDQSARGGVEEGNGDARNRNRDAISFMLKLNARSS